MDEDGDFEGVTAAEEKVTPDGCLTRLGRVPPVTRAVILVQNALHGRPVAPITPTSLVARRLYHNIVYRIFFLVVIIINLCLAAWEPPSDTDPGPGAALAFLRALDGITLVLMSLDSAVEYLYFGNKVFWRKKWTVCKTFALPIMFLNLFLSLPNNGMGVDGYKGVLRMVRPLFILERLRNVRQIFSNIVRMVPKVANVAILLGLSTLFFGVMGKILYGESGFNISGSVLDPQCSLEEHIKFKDAIFANPNYTLSRNEGSYSLEPICSVFSKTEVFTGDGNCRNYFSTLSESMYHLFTLQTTANFPDVMLPVFECSKWNAVFFILYLVINLFFLLNLTLAVAADEFSRLTETKVISRYENMFRGVDQAFDALWEAEEERIASDEPIILADGSHGKRPRATGIKYISRNTWVDFFTAHRPKIHPDLVALFFDAIDGDKRGIVYLFEFRRMVLYFSPLRTEATAPEARNDFSRSLSKGLSSLSILGGGEKRSDSVTTPRKRFAAADDATEVRNPLDSSPAPKKSGTSLPPPTISGDGVAGKVDDEETDSGAVVGGEVSRGGDKAEHGDEVGLGEGKSGEDKDDADSQDSEVDEDERLAALPWYAREKLQRTLSQRWLMIFFDAVVLINSVLVLIELEDTNEDDDDVIEVFQYIALAIFVTEVVLKVYAWGLLPYLKRSSFNKLDLFLVTLSLVAVIVLSATGQSNWGSVVTFFRVVRMLRILRVLPDFALTVTSFLDVLPVLMQYLTVLLCIFYSFAMVGMASYSSYLPPPPGDDRDACMGDVTPAAKASVATRVCRSPYGQSDYYSLNFDGLGSAMSVMFALLVVNNWNIVLEGLEAAFVTTWVRWYFVFFNLVAVIVVLNVLVAFLIDSFSIQRTRREAARERVMSKDGDEKSFRRTLSRANSGLSSVFSRRSDSSQRQSGFAEALQAVKDWLTEMPELHTQDDMTWSMSIEKLERDAAIASSKTQANLSAAAAAIGAAAAAMKRHDSESGGGAAGSGVGDTIGDSAAPPSLAVTPSPDNSLDSVAVGEEWRNILMRSKLDFSAWRIWREPRPQDIYDTLYKDAIRKAFPSTFNKSRRGSVRHAPRSARVGGAGLFGAAMRAVQASSGAPEDT